MRKIWISTHDTVHSLNKVMLPQSQLSSFVGWWRKKNYEWDVPYLVRSSPLAFWSSSWLKSDHRSAKLRKRVFIKSTSDSLTSPTVSHIIRLTAGNVTRKCWSLPNKKVVRVVAASVAEWLTAGYSVIVISHSPPPRTHRHKVRVGRRLGYTRLFPAADPLSSRADGHARPGGESTVRRRRGVRFVVGRGGQDAVWRGGRVRRGAIQLTGGGAERRQWPALESGAHAGRWGHQKRRDASSTPARPNRLPFT